MSPRQLAAWKEHGEALDRIQDARDLCVGLLAGRGDAKEVTKHFKAWAEGKSPVKTEKQQLTEEDKVKLKEMREAWDKERAGNKEKPN